MCGASPSVARRARPSCPAAPTTSVFFGGIGVTSARRGWALSFSEISTSESGIGHAMAAVSSARFRNEYEASGDQWSFTRYVYAVSGSSVWYELPTPRGTKMARDGSSSVVKTVPNEGPSRRSTQAPKMRPVATDTHLSQGSAWMPRVVPTASLKEMLFCTGPKSSRPRATIFSRCQFSLNQPRESPWTGSSNTTRPGMGVSMRSSFFPNAALTGPCPRRTPRRRPCSAPTTTRCRGTSRSSPTGPPRSRRTADASRARCAASWSRSRSGGRGPRGR